MPHSLLQDYIEINRKEIKSYMKLILGSKCNAKILEKFEETYINVRYYNYAQKEGNTIRQKIINSFKKLEEELINLHGEENEELIKNIGLFYTYILHFDTIANVKNIQGSIEKLNKLRLRILNENNKKFEKDFYEKYIEFKNEKENITKKYESEEFFLKTTPYPGHPNVYRVNINFDIKFPMVYSQTAIEKAFNYGITNEDKLTVEYYLISINIINDLSKGNFKRQYIIEFADTLLDKPKKMKSVLKIVDSQAIQEKVSFKITYEQFLNHKDKYYELMRSGFRFAVILDEKFIVEYNELKKLDVFSYVLLNKKIKKYDEIIQNKILLENLIEI